MEFTSAILMVLGIYVGIPIVLVFAVGGAYVFGRRLAEKAKREAQASEAAAKAKPTRTVYRGM